ncbi:MAG TPA: hypothetical protein VGY54_18375 [Polyangiaceae bacterium]|nr:hypothetical protein [Polyangiaceae bacterium]
MRRLLFVVAALAPLLGASEGKAADRDPAMSLAVAAGIDALGFVVGSALLSTSHGDNVQNNAGWLTIESGFVLAPLAAHGARGRWGRGVVFAAVPAASLAGSATVFAVEPGAVEHGTLPQQRWIWALFGVGLFSSAWGAVDAMLVGDSKRTIALQPTVGWGQAGLQIGGTL